MDEARVRKLADGRVYSGAQAKDLGLVDQLGTLEDAVELAAKRGGLEASRRFTIHARSRSAGGSVFFMGGIRSVRLPIRRGWLRYEWSLVCCYE